MIRSTIGIALAGSSIRCDRRIFISITGHGSQSARHYGKVTEAGRVATPAGDGRGRWRVQGAAGRLPWDARRAGYQSTRSIPRLRRLCRLEFAGPTQKRRLVGRFQRRLLARFSADAAALLGQDYRRVSQDGIAGGHRRTGGLAMIIQSTDEGKTWSKPVTLHRHAR